MTEIDQSNLAIALSPTFAVVRYAQQEVVDDTSLNIQLASIAQSEQLPVPSALSSSAVQASIAETMTVHEAPVKHSTQKGLDTFQDRNIAVKI